jgi:hypothetical protein
MTIVGFNFNKINVERTASKTGNLTISNNFGITGVSESPLALGGKAAKAIKFEFNFQSKYEPDVANITLVGDLLFMFPTELADKVLKDWKDSKKLNDQVAESVMNSILNRCNIEALFLSREMNLPSPIPLPKVNVTKKSSVAATTAPAKAPAKTVNKVGK